MVAGVSQIHIPRLRCRQPQASGANGRQTLMLGAENQLVESMITRLASTDQVVGSPFVFWGVSGTGKSLITQCLVHYWGQRTSATLPALLTNGSDWAHHVDAAGNQTSKHVWLTTSKRISLFVIEDIELLANHTRAQYELALLLDDLESRSIPIIATCKQLPMEVHQLEPRLISRLQAGTLIRVHLPSEETKLAFANTLKLNIDVRESLHRRLASVESLQQVVALAKQLLVTGAPTNKPIEAQAVIKLCAKYFDVSIRDLRGHTRRRAISYARQVTILILRDTLGLPLKQIGQLLGNRDHSTVLHAYRKITSEVREDSTSFAAVQEIRNQVHRLQGLT